MTENDAISNWINLPFVILCSIILLSVIITINYNLKTFLIPKPFSSNYKGIHYQISETALACCVIRNQLHILNLVRFLC